MRLDVLSRSTAWSWTSILAIGLTLLLAGAVQAEEAMTLTLESDAVVVSSLTPGDTVALLSISRQMFDSIVRSERRDEWLVDEDLDGEVRLPLERAAPEQSLWLAVSLSTGGWTTVSGGPEIGGPLTLGDSGDIFASPAFIQTGTRFEVLVLRPGDSIDAGVWGGAAADGASRDLDGLADRLVGIGPALLMPVGASPPPPAVLQAGDVVVVLDPSTLHYGIETVKDGRGDAEVGR